MRAASLWLSALMCVLVLALSTPARAEVFQVVSGRLEGDDSVMTAGASGATLRLAKNVTLRAWPGTRLYRVHKRVKLWLSNEGRTLTHVVALESGRVDVDLGDPTRGVLVRSPLDMAVALRAGRMSIVGRGGQVTIVNHEGSVIWARGAGRFQRLEPSKIKTVAKEWETETALLPPPRVRLENNLYGGFGKGAELTGVDWQAVDQATGYRVSIRQIEPESRILAQLDTIAPVLSPPPQLPAGRYTLSVQAIDRFGIEGIPSAPEPLSVVGVSTSNGGYIDRRGHIVAGYDRRFKLTFADGLIMKGGAHDWQPVPEEIVLPSGEPMSIHVRQAGDTRLLSTRVFPHPVKAEVTVGPKLVRWPGESVQIAVSIVGPEGQAAPAWLEPRFRVLLGIDELDVAWQRVDDRFIAEVPAQAGDGPWVVRAEVEDQYGHLLGRDFVEIAPQKLPAPVAPPRPLTPAQASR